MGNLRGEPISLDEYFAGSDPHSSELFEVLRTAVESLGPVEVRATKSQIAFRRRLGFAWTWIPGQYLTGHKDLAPLVLDGGPPPSRRLPPLEVGGRAHTRPLHTPSRAALR